MNLVTAAYVHTAMALTSALWFLNRIWVTNNLTYTDLIMHAVICCVLSAYAYLAWQKIAYTLSKNRYCKCGHLRGRHDNDGSCLQESLSLYPINKKQNWVPCDCQGFKHDWSVVK
jgi:hypothetical protein